MVVDLDSLPTPDYDLYFRKYPVLAEREIKFIMGYQKSLSMFKEMNLDTMRYPGFLEKAIQIEKEGIENVENKNGWYHVDICPLCRGRRQEIEFTKLGIDIVCCLECSLRYAGRFPVNTEDIYSDGKYQEAVVNIYMKNHAFKMENFGK